MAKPSFTTGPIAVQSLRAVVFKGRESWVVQCLEYDIAAQAPSLEALPVRLARALLAEIEFSQQRGEVPFSTLPRAPEKYWDMVPGATEEDRDAWRPFLPGFVDDRLSILRAASASV
jgi:hypothetical protein